MQPLVNDCERDRKLDKNVQKEKQHDYYQAASVIAALTGHNFR
ncbi:hypothetical protein ACIP6T_11110 [Pantoea sp. NPDC088449]